MFHVSILNHVDFGRRFHEIISRQHFSYWATVRIFRSTNVKCVRNKKAITIPLFKSAIYNYASNDEAADEYQRLYIEFAHQSSTLCSLWFKLCHVHGLLARQHCLSHRKVRWRYYSITVKFAYIEQKTQIKRQQFNDSETFLQIKRLTNKLMNKKRVSNAWHILPV